MEPRTRVFAFSFRYLSEAVRKSKSSKKRTFLKESRAVKADFFTASLPDTEPRTNAHQLPI
jgi:hypothetical protein